MDRRVKVNFWPLWLGVTVAWSVIGVLPLLRAAAGLLVGAVVLLLSGWFPRWRGFLAPLVLPGLYAALVGWIDLRAVFPTLVLLALTCACDWHASCRRRRVAAGIAYAILGVGMALRLMPPWTGLMLLAAPLVLREARCAQTITDAQLSAEGLAALFLWVGYLIHGLVR